MYYTKRDGDDMKLAGHMPDPKNVYPVNPKRRTIGLRVPSHPIALALLEELGEPLMSVTLILPGESEPMEDPYEIRDALEKQVDLIIDGGFGGNKASTVISLVDSGDPEIVRVGCGDPQPFMVEA